jgi:uncharacterized protein (DUF1684 family)
VADRVALAASTDSAAPADPVDFMDLADWRRQVADLYASVRRLAASDPQAAWEQWRTTREALYREHPQSPLPSAARPSFRARYFPYDASLRFELPVHQHSTAATEEGKTALPSSTGDPLRFRPLGWVDVPFPAGARRLGLYWMEGYAGGLFLPFRDVTNGRETYGAGRYLLDGAKSADLGGGGRRTLIVDFNFAYHPSCAFDVRWACPLAPPENRLDVPVRAGERTD